MTTLEDKSFVYPVTDLYNYVTGYLEGKEISLTDLAGMSQDLQKRFLPDVPLSKYTEAIESVLKREDTLNAFAVGIFLDKSATDLEVDSPLQEILDNDAGLFGVDETLASSIAVEYGQIGITSFGYLDHSKKGVLNKIDKDTSSVNVFLDDLLGALVSATAAKVAHSEEKKS